MIGPVQAKGKEVNKYWMKDWNRLDSSEIVTNSVRAFDYVDDLIEQQMRESIKKQFCQ